MTTHQMIASGIWIFWLTGAAVMTIASIAGFDRVVGFMISLLKPFTSWGAPVVLVAYTIWAFLAK